MKVLDVMVLPKVQTVITEDMPPAEQGERGPLAMATLKHMGAIMDEHPEVVVGFGMLYTPRPEGHEGPFDECHTAVLTGDHEVSPAVLRSALTKIIPALISLHMSLEKEGGLVEQMVVKKKEK